MSQVNAGMASAAARLRFVVGPQTSVKHSATVIFLHGSGDTGEGIRDWVSSLVGSNFTFPHIRTIYPTAPIRPYTPNAGLPCSVWYDRQQISPYVPEDSFSIEKSCEQINQLIDDEVKGGVPLNRIILGGFSMGGAMALYHAITKTPGVAGIFALSSFLNRDSLVYNTIKSGTGPWPPLFQCHGDSDPLVLYDWGMTTHDTLTDLGINGPFHTYKGLFHEMCKDEILKLKRWIEEKVPELS